MDGLRFIVGAENGGPRSALWRIWTGDKKSDVYLSVRGIAGEVNVSLHENGDWRFAFTDVHMRRHRTLAPQGERTRHRWPRPPEFVPGFTRAFFIAIPESELRTPPVPDKFNKPVTWVAAPPPGGHVDVDLFLARRASPEGRPGRRSLGTRLLLRQSLPSGEELIVTSRVAEMSAVDRARLDGYKREALRLGGDALLAARSAGANLRAVFFNVPEEDSPSDLPCGLADVALPWPDVANGG